MEYECMQVQRREAYLAVLKAIYAQCNDLWDKEVLLSWLRMELNLSEEFYMEAVEIVMQDPEANALRQGRVLDNVQINSQVLNVPQVQLSNNQYRQTAQGQNLVSNQQGTGTPENQKSQLLSDTRGQNKSSRRGRPPGQSNKQYRNSTANIDNNNNNSSNHNNNNYNNNNNINNDNSIFYDNNNNNNIHINKSSVIQKQYEQASQVRESYTPPLNTTTAQQSQVQSQSPSGQKQQIENNGTKRLGQAEQHNKSTKWEPGKQRLQMDTQNRALFDNAQYEVDQALIEPDIQSIAGRGLEIVGRRVLRYWPQYQSQWQEAMVLSFNSNLNQHRLVYDIGQDSESYEMYQFSEHNSSDYKLLRPTERDQQLMELLKRPNKLRGRKNLKKSSLQETQNQIQVVVHNSDNIKDIIPQIEMMFGKENDLLGVLLDLKDESFSDLQHDTEYQECRRLLHIANNRERELISQLHELEALDE